MNVRSPKVNSKRTPENAPGDSVNSVALWRMIFPIFAWPVSRASLKAARSSRQKKSVSTRPGVGITRRASHNPGRSRRDIDGKHRGDNVRTGPAATIRRPRRGGPDRGSARRLHRSPRRIGRVGLRGDPDTSRPSRADLLPPRAGRHVGGRRRVPGDVPRPVSPRRFDPGR